MSFLAKNAARAMNFIFNWLYGPCFSQMYFYINALSRGRVRV